MVYESGFTTRRTYSTRPVVSSYAVSKITSIDWNKHPYVPRPTLIADPVTAFGSKNRTRESMKSTILNPLNRASIKPNYDKIFEPVMTYVPVRDRNRERILKMAHQHTANVEAGANGTARFYRDSIDTSLPRIHRAVSETSPVKREIFRNEKSGATYPVVHRTSNVYRTSYPIYSTYSIPKRVLGVTRVITSPIRFAVSPPRLTTRSYRSPSPVRVIRTTTRIISSPERKTTYTYSTPLSYETSRYISPLSQYSSSYRIPSTSYYYAPISRSYSRSVSPVRITTTATNVYKGTPPGYGARALTNYLSTEPYTTFREETGRIRHRAQSLMREVHTPVVRRAVSCTPFPVWRNEPTSPAALDAYVARITNPVRHIAKEVYNMSLYPEPAHKYLGKSHLASVRICGDKAYNIRKPMYDSDKIRTDINILSWYLREKWANSKKELENKGMTI